MIIFIVPNYLKGDNLFYKFIFLKLTITPQEVSKSASIKEKKSQLNEDDFKNSYVVLDELSKLLNYMRAKILHGIRKEVFTIFT